MTIFRNEADIGVAELLVVTSRMTYKCCGSLIHWHQNSKFLSMISYDNPQQCIAGDNTTLGIATYNRFRDITLD